MTTREQFADLARRALAAPVTTTRRELLKMIGAERRTLQNVAELGSRLARHHLSLSSDLDAVGADTPIQVQRRADPRPTPVQQLSDVCNELDSKRPSPAVTMRTFLGWFGATRRGLNIVEQIRVTLLGFDLRTIPDFEEASVDAEVSFELTDVTPTSMVEPTADTSSAVAASVVAVEHPHSSEATPSISTDSDFTIGSLVPKSQRADGEKGLIQIRPQQPLLTAMTLLQMHDVTHLPIMQSPYDVKGVVTWASIGSYLAKHPRLDKSVMVEQAMLLNVEIVPESTEFKRAVTRLLEDGYVFVRNAQNRVIGVVTTADLAGELWENAKLYMTMGEIERHLRRVLQSAGLCTSEVLQGAQSARDGSRPVASVSDLTLGQIHQVLADTEHWERLRTSVTREVFLERFNVVREIRNGIMHFRSNITTSQDARTLDTFLRNLRTNFAL